MAAGETVTGGENFNNLLEMTVNLVNAGYSELERKRVVFTLVIVLNAYLDLFSSFALFISNNYIAVD